MVREEPKDLQALVDFLSGLVEKTEPAGNPKLAADGNKALAQALHRLSEAVGELHEFAKALCEGHLDAVSPSRENALCWELKALRSHLSHLNWQMQAVSQGDYSQHIDFLGDYSITFNAMIQQLRDREEALREAKLRAEKRTKELTEQQNLLQYIMGQARQAILVLEEATGSELFCNASLVRWRDRQEKVVAAVVQRLRAYRSSGKASWELAVEDPAAGKKRLYAVETFPLVWMGKPSVVHQISDVTKEKEKLRRFEREAAQDFLTGTYNRRYCRKKMQEMLSGGIPFLCCFMDMDGLKQVNDTWGHREGDRYIRTTADILTGRLSDGEVLSRVGGDEFVLLIPGGEEKAAFSLLQMANSQLEKKSGKYRMRFSYGVESVESGDTRMASDILAAADHKMYRFKENQKKDS